MSFSMWHRLKANNTAKDVLAAGAGEFNPVLLAGIRRPPAQNSIAPVCANPLYRSAAAAQLGLAQSTVSKPLKTPS
jgi:hypothetical protein